MAIKLKEAGIDDFVVIEKADSLAGTWRENTYPGCACDVPSHMYSFSFEPNPDWSRDVRAAAGDPRLPRALRRQVRRPPPHRASAPARSARPGTRRPASGAASARGPTAESSGPRASSSRASAACTCRPSPDLHGLESFEGDVFHSADWDHDVDLEGKRVAVIGTGASAIQFVPEIAGEVAPARPLPAHRALGPAQARPPHPQASSAGSTAASRSSSARTAAASTGTSSSSCYRGVTVAALRARCSSAPAARTSSAR